MDNQINPVDAGHQRVDYRPDWAVQHVAELPGWPRETIDYRGSAYTVVEVPPQPGRAEAASHTVIDAAAGSPDSAQRRAAGPASAESAAAAALDYQRRLLADSELAAQRTQAAAEEQAARIVREARAQAEQVMRSAKFHAQRMIGNAKIESAVAGRRVAELRQLEGKLRESIKDLLAADEPGAARRLGPPTDLRALRPDPATNEPSRRPGPGPS